MILMLTEYLTIVYVYVRLDMFVYFSYLLL